MDEATSVPAKSWTSRPHVLEEKGTWHRGLLCHGKGAREGLGGMQNRTSTDQADARTIRTNEVRGKQGAHAAPVVAAYAKLTTSNSKHVG